MDAHRTSHMLPTDRASYEYRAKGLLVSSVNQRETVGAWCPMDRHYIDSAHYDKWA